MCSPPQGGFTVATSHYTIDTAPPTYWPGVPAIQAATAWSAQGYFNPLPAWSAECVQTDELYEGCGMPTPFTPNTTRIMRPLPLAGCGRSGHSPPQVGFAALEQGPLHRKVGWHLTRPLHPCGARSDYQLRDRCGWGPRGRSGHSPPQGGFAAHGPLHRKVGWRAVPITTADAP